VTSPAVDIASSEFLGTPVQCLAALREQGATSLTTEGWVIVNDFDLARTVLTDPKTYSSHIHKHVSVPADIADEVAAIRAQGWPYTNALGTSDAPDHTRNRQMVNKAFTPRALTALEPLVLSLIHI
jgi:cytochrome P450